MRADAARRRQGIIRAAKHVFAERGGDVALEVVAAASGVGIATLYRNFPSRYDLVYAVVEDTVERILDAVTAARGAAGQDPSAAWADLLARLVDMELGALIDAIGLQARSGSKDASALGHLQQPALDALDELLSVLKDAAAIRRDIKALEVIVAVATITRPQVTPIREAAPAVHRQLADAYLAWSRSDQ